MLCKAQVQNSPLSLQKFGNNTRVHQLHWATSQQLILFNENYYTDQLITFSKIINAIKKLYLSYLSTSFGFSLYGFTRTRAPQIKCGFPFDKICFTVSALAKVTKPNIRLCWQGIRTSCTGPKLLNPKNKN